MNPTDNDVVCPFCDEKDFDLRGLKSHLSCGDCQPFNEIPAIARPLSGWQPTTPPENQEFNCLPACPACRRIHPKGECEADKPQDVCEWIRDNETDAFNTGCGNAFILNDGTPAENKMKSCPYCGREIGDQKL